MKNKTLTLFLSLILLSSMFIACGASVKEEVTQKIKIEEKFKMKENDINIDLLDKAISKSILKTTERLDSSELSTEGHILLGTTIENNILNAYIIAAISNYGIQNETFTCISKTATIPTVISYQVNPDNGRYTEIDYREVNPTTNEYTIESLFPENFREAAENANSYYSEIEKMQIKQATEYLDFIDRDLPVKPLLKKEIIPILADSNFAKNAPDFPTWEGSCETYKNGQRFVYESKKIKVNGKDMIICTKTNEDGTVLMKFSVDENGNIEEIKED
ncbi:MAG: hypothetical protein ACRDCW_04730 [Sarcina sp.]